MAFPITKAVLGPPEIFSVLVLEIPLVVCPKEYRGLKIRVASRIRRVGFIKYYFVMLISFPFFLICPLKLPKLFHSPSITLPSFLLKTPFPKGMLTILLLLTVSMLIPS